MDDVTNEKKLSVFNAGVGKAIRLDNLITRYNNASLNPMAFDYVIRQYNFQIMFATLDRLYKEAIGKADENEKKLCEPKIKAIALFMQKYPVVTLNGNNKQVINYNNWLILEKSLKELEDDIRIVLDAHDLDTPTKQRYMGL